MFNILFKYLLINRQVSIPGVGDFKLVDHPAKIDYAAQVVHPPATTVQFANKSATADKNFFRFASAELGVEDWDTIRKFHDFSFKLKNELDTELFVDLPGMGMLTKDNTGKIAFKPKKLPTEYFPAIPFQPEPVEPEPTPPPPEEAIVNNTLTDELQPHEVVETKENFWWIAALVLTLFSIAAIAYYYLVVHPA